MRRDSPRRRDDARGRARGGRDVRRQRGAPIRRVGIRRRRPGSVAGAIIAHHRTRPTTKTKTKTKTKTTSGGRLVGFAELPARFVDGTCKKGFYSVDARRGLLAAGGDGGRCAVFAPEPVHHPARVEETNSWTRRTNGDGDEKSAPGGMGTRRRRRRRIARRTSAGDGSGANRRRCRGPRTGVGARRRSSPTRPLRSRSHSATTNASYLLTAGGMDGTVCSWDLAVKSQATGAPKLTWRLDAGRGSGVFSMHHARDELLVGCKDWTVRRWRVGEGVVRGAVDLDPTACVEYDGLHAGVVRCVRWNDASPGGDSPGGDVAVTSPIFHTRRTASGVNGCSRPAAATGASRSWTRGSRRVARRWRGWTTRTGADRSTSSSGGAAGNGNGPGRRERLLLAADVRRRRVRPAVGPPRPRDVPATRRDAPAKRVKGGEGDAPMTLELSREFTGHHRAGLTRPKMTRAVFVFDGTKTRPIFVFDDE